jgi:hypothetical protein
LVLEASESELIAFRMFCVVVAASVSVVAALSPIVFRMSLALPVVVVTSTFVLLINSLTANLAASAM